MKKIIQTIIICGLVALMGKTASGGPTAQDLLLLMGKTKTKGAVKENTAKLKKTKICIKCDLSGVKLMGDKLSGADLTEANLTGAILMMLDLSKANLNKANLTGAKLTMVNLSGADLTEANLTGATLNGQKFDNTNLTKANFTKANVNVVSIVNTNMNYAILTDAKFDGLGVRTSKNIDNLQVVGVDATGCQCPTNLLGKIKVSDPAWLKEQADKKLKAEEEGAKKLAKIQKEKKKKLRRAAKQQKKAFKKEIKRFLIAYKVLEDSIKKIETCCDNADDKGDPELKNYIATQKRNFTGKAESLKETYSTQITLGKDLGDSSKKDQMVQRFIEINPKIKHNPGCSRAPLGSLTKGGDEVVTYEELQECHKEVEAEVEKKFGATSADFYRQLPMEIIKECGDIKNKCVDGGIDQFQDMTLAFERDLEKIKDEARFHSSEKFNIALTKFIKDKEVRELREKRMAAAKAKIALINNTLVYKEMVAGFEKGFVSHPSNVMVMMKLKVLGKSDQEIFEYLRAGIKSYKSCMLNEVANRFTNDQLKLMATEYGTNKLEIISLNVKCETAAAQTVKRVLQSQ